MTFFLQHGYGKGSKLEDIGAVAAVDGVILSPADEDPPSLRATADSARRLGATPLLDPQTYVYTTAPAGEGRKHETHGLNFHSVHWSQTPAEIEGVVSSVHAANVTLGTDSKMIAPTCVQSSFSDVWTPLALQYARTASTRWGENATLATLCVEDSAFAKWDDVADWLDIATTLDVRGFYIVIDRRKTPYPSAVWDVTRLRNVLRLIYNLSVLNDYEVIWGYSDIDGAVGTAAGADAVASGWHYSLRNFTTTKWQPSPAGGRAPNPRLYLAHLWTPVLLETEGESIAGTSIGTQVFPPDLATRFNADGFNSWTRLEAQVTHLQTLSRRVNAVEKAGPISNRCDRVLGNLRRAQGYFDTIAAEGILVPGVYKARVDALTEAVELFTSAENL